MSSPLRLFVAVDPAAEVRERIARELPRLRALAPRARWVDAAGLHVTLAFLGDVDEGAVPALADAIAAVAKRHAPMDLRFVGGGIFGSARRGRVLWAGVDGALDALGAMHGDLGAALETLGFPREERALSVHLTLARARDPRGDPALAGCAEALAGVELGATRVEGVVLYRSELGGGGSRYTALATASLG